MKARPFGRIPIALAAARKALLGGAALLSLAAAGCGGDGPSLLPQDDPQAGNSPAAAAPEALIGSWVLPGSGCDQLLVLRNGGTFTLAARMRLNGATGLAEVGGEFAIAETPDGGLTLGTSEVETLGPAAPVYCDQWRNRAGVALDFDQIETETGSDPGTLALRTEVSATLGRIVIGSDDARNDRVALVTGGGEVRVYVLSDQAVDPPFFQARFTDASRWTTEQISLVVVLPLPRATLFALYPETTGGQTLLKRLLNVTAAVEVSAQAVASSGLTGCTLVFYDDSAFSNVVSTMVLDASGEPTLFPLNPRDPALVAEQQPHTGPAGDSTAYIVPVAIEAPGSNGCSLFLKARPLVVSFLEELASDDPALAFTLPLPGPHPQRAEATPAEPKRLLLEPLLPRLVQGAVRLMPDVVSVLPLELNGDGEAPYFDILDLLQAGENGATADLNGGEGSETLSLFGPGAAGVGLGPFSAYQRPDPDATLTPPATAQGSLAEQGDEQAFRLSLDEPGRLVLRSEGGLELQGSLLNRYGVVLVENRQGAADGQGFYVVRTLAAGSYDLVVKLLGEGGSYTVRAEDGTAIPFADDALAACAIEAGWASGVAVEEVTCRNRGVASLTGLATLPVLKRLTAGGNGITDLSPLADASDLRELSLDGNSITDLAPLAGLVQLERLSLADTPIGADQLDTLAGLAATLTHLDLSGVSALNNEEAGQLQPANSNLVLILPDGTVLE